MNCKCGNKGIHKQFDTFSYWYCNVCKTEIKETPKLLDSFVYSGRRQGKATVQKLIQERREGLDQFDFSDLYQENEFEKY